MSVEGLELTTGWFLEKFTSPDSDKLIHIKGKWSDSFLKYGPLSMHNKHDQLWILLLWFTKRSKRQGCSQFCLWILVGNSQDGQLRIVIKRNLHNSGKKNSIVVEVAVLHNALDNIPSSLNEPGRNTIHAHIAFLQDYLYPFSTSVVRS